MKVSGLVPGLVIFCLLGFVTPGVSEEGTFPPAVRLSGNDRVETAVAVSRSAWAKSEHVIVSSAYNYPDALVGVALAARFDGPILLTHPARLRDSVLGEIGRLGASSVWITGGEAAVSSMVDRQLQERGVQVNRVAGSERFSTGAAVALLAGAPDDEAVVALGSHTDPSRAWPDAVSAGTLAVTSARPPILLAQPHALPEASADALKALGVSKVFIAGGTAAIEPAVEREIRGLGLDAERIGGADRFETSSLLARAAIERLGAGNRPLVIATGTDFPDALTAGALSAHVGGILVIVPDDLQIAPSLGDLMREMGASVSSLQVVGGESAVPARLVSQVISELNGSLPTDGFPGAHNTGVPPGTELRRHDGDLIVTQPGSLVDAVEVSGNLYIYADDVHVTRSRIHGEVKNFERTPPYTAHFFLMEDSEIGPDLGYLDESGVGDSNFTLRRVEVHDTIDGVRANGRVTIEDSWIHDLYYKCGGPSSDPCSHNDAVQNVGGTGDVMIRGNTLDAYPYNSTSFEGNAAVQSGGDPIGTTYIERNLLAGGVYTLQIYDPGMQYVVRDNVFVRESYGHGTHTYTHRDNIVWEGNAFEDGEPIPL